MTEAEATDPVRPDPVEWNQMIEMTNGGSLESRALAIALVMISDQLDYIARLLEQLRDGRSGR